MLQTQNRQILLGGEEGFEQRTDWLNSGAQCEVTWRPVNSWNFDAF